MTNALTTNLVTNIGHNLSWVDPTGIAAMASVFGALCSLATILSLFLFKKQITSDHDRSRRERAADLMECWVTSQDPTNREVVFGLQLLQTLTHEQSVALWNRQQFQIDPKYQNVLDSYRASSILPCRKGTQTAPAKASRENQLMLRETEVLMLRRLAISMLNKLELIASEWHNNIADREIIEAEFIKVFSPEEGHYYMDKFREVSGIYPSIREICQHIEKNKQVKSVGKPALGV
jgi:hypothetical protein